MGTAVGTAVGESFWAAARMHAVGPRDEEMGETAARMGQGEGGRAGHCGITATPPRGMVGPHAGRTAAAAAGALRRADRCTTAAWAHRCGMLASREEQERNIVWFMWITELDEGEWAHGKGVYAADTIRRRSSSFVLQCIEEFSCSWHD